MLARLGLSGGRAITGTPGLFPDNARNGGDGASVGSVRSLCPPTLGLLPRRWARLGQPVHLDIPCAAPTDIAVRTHYLTPVELARLWQAAERPRGSGFGDLARFLITALCQRREAAWLNWAHLNPSAGESRQPATWRRNMSPVSRLGSFPPVLRYRSGKEFGGSGRWNNGAAARCRRMR
jgi:hypothetical protein